MGDNEVTRRNPRQSNDTLCTEHPEGDVVYVRTGPLTVAGGCGPCFDKGVIPSAPAYNAAAYHDAYLASLRRAQGDGWNGSTHSKY